MKAKVSDMQGEIADLKRDIEKLLFALAKIETAVADMSHKTEDEFADNGPWSTFGQISATAKLAKIMCWYKPESI